MKIWCLGALVLCFLSSAQKTPRLGIGSWRITDVPTVGQNLELSNTPFRPSNTANFTSGLAALNPAFVRYPGGSTANWWNSTTGWFCNKTTDALCANIPEQYVQQTRVPWTLDDLALLHRGGALTALTFVVNMVSSTLESELGHLQTAVDLGIPLSLVELTNEVYLPGDAGVVAKYPTAETYVIEALKWAEAIKARFPTVKVAMPMFFSGLYATAGYNDSRYATWNDKVLSLVVGKDEFLDGWVIHPYFVNGLDYTDNGLNWGMCYETAEKGEIFGTPELQQLEESRYNSTSGATVHFGVPFDGFKNFSKEMEPLINGAFSSKRLFLTENNYLAYCGPTRLSWGHGLFVTSWYFLSMQLPATATTILYGAAGNPLFTALQFWPETFQGLCCNWAIQDTWPFTPSALGIAYGQILSSSARSATAVAPLTIQNQVNISNGYRNVTYPSLLGAAFRQPNNVTTAVFLNLASFEQIVDVTTIRNINDNNPLNFTIVNAKHTKWISRGDQDITANVSALTTPTLLLPPYSAIAIY